MQEFKKIESDVEHFMGLITPNEMAEWIMNSSMYLTENMLLYGINKKLRSYMHITQYHKLPFYTLPTKECINKIISIIKLYNIDFKPVKITEVCAGIGLFGRILRNLNYEVELTDENKEHDNVFLDIMNIKPDYFKSDRFNVCICIWPYPWTDTTQIIDENNVNLLITIGEPVGWATGVNIPSPSAHTSVSVCESIPCSMITEIPFLNCMYVTTKRKINHIHPYSISPELYDKIGEDEQKFMAAIKPAKFELIQTYYNKLNIINPLILKK